MRKYQKIQLAPIIENSMPKPAFELSEEKIEKFKTYSKVLLVLLSVTGLLTMTILAPNAIQALEIFEKRRAKKPLKRSEKIKKVTNAFYYLRRWGHIEIKKIGKDFEVKMTNKGKEVLKRLNMEVLSVPMPEKWDGNFWQVAADVPTEDYRSGADALRLKLKEMGFFHLQRTLWFYPFDPRMEIEFITRFYGIANFVTVMKVTELDPSDSNALKTFFKKNRIL
ncbi:MAG: hypothetical protein Q8R08_03485 [bacterium]|nr:hypothetical protein [bacterium]